ncbi:MAG: hypothetical protein ACI4Q4_06785 [Oscillospiraceae bacterium]
MARKPQNIKVILHPPEDQKSLDALQETTTLLYAKIILNKISKFDLTPAEKEYVVRRVIEELEAQNT